MSFVSSSRPQRGLPPLPSHYDVPREGGSKAKALSPVRPHSSVHSSSDYYNEVKGAEGG